MPQTLAESIHQAKFIFFVSLAFFTGRVQMKVLITLPFFPFDCQVLSSKTRYWKKKNGNVVRVLIMILVTPAKEDLTINSVWKEFDETTVELTCSVDRIKPSCAEMFWKINDERINTTVETKANKDGNSLSQLIKVEYKWVHAIFSLSHLKF